MKLFDKKYYIAPLSIVCAVFVLPHFAFAARLYFTAPNGATATVGSIIPIEVRLNSDGESVNAAAVAIKYSKNKIEVTDWSDAGSIISLWLERPDLKKTLINFQGTMPGGYNWQDGMLARFYVKLLQSGSLTIDFDASSEVLKNDGTGSRVKLVVAPLVLTAKNGIAGEFMEESDIYPPESFTPELVRNADAFGGKQVLVFATQDKQLGIDHYEIQETSSSVPLDDKWVPVTSPYIIEDQTQESYIFVKAVDRKGNERVAKVYPASYALKMQILKYGLLGVLILAGIAAFYFVRRRRRRGRG